MIDANILFRLLLDETVQAVNKIKTACNRVLEMAVYYNQRLTQNDRMTTLCIHVF